MSKNDTLIYPEEAISGTEDTTRKPVLKSVIAPKKPGDIRSASFSANGEDYTVDVDLNRYSTRVVREHSRKSRATDKIEDEDEREDAQFETGLDFAVVGAMKTTAPVELSRDGLLDANFNVAIGLIEAVQKAVFPSSSVSPEQ